MRVALRSLAVAGLLAGSLALNGCEADLYESEPAPAPGYYYDYGPGWYGYDEGPWFGGFYGGGWGDHDHHHWNHDHDHGEFRGGERHLGRAGHAAAAHVGGGGGAHGAGGGGHR